MASFLVVESSTDGGVPEEGGSGEVCDVDGGNAALLAVVEDERALRRELLGDHQHMMST